MATPMTIQTREAARPEIAAAAAREITPPVDIYETDTSYVLLADMPGVVVRPIAAKAPRREIVVAWRAGSSRAAEAGLLAEALRID